MSCDGCKAQEFQPTYYGLVENVARKLGIKANYVTRVKTGRAADSPKAQRVRKELIAEMNRMDRDRSKHGR